MVVGGGPGDASARLVLLQGVSLLRPEDAVCEAMLEGGRGSSVVGGVCSRRRSGTGFGWWSASRSS